MAVLRGSGIFLFGYISCSYLWCCFGFLRRGCSGFGWTRDVPRGQPGHVGRGMWEEKGSGRVPRDWYSKSESDSTVIPSHLMVHWEVHPHPLSLTLVRSLQRRERMWRASGARPVSSVSCIMFEELCLKVEPLSFGNRTCESWTKRLKRERKRWERRQKNKNLQ